MTDKKECSDISTDRMPDDATAQDMVRNNINWMLAVAERLLGDRSLAEDAVQDAFLSAFKKLGSFEQRSSLKTWLHRITVNAALMKLRQRKRRAEQSIEELLPQFDDDDCRLEIPWQDSSGVQQIVARDQLHRHIREKIALLPEDYRIVLLLRDIEGYSTEEVAGLLELSSGNAKVRLHRARAALKKLLEPSLRDEVSAK